MSIKCIFIILSLIIAFTACDITTDRAGTDNGAENSNGGGFSAGDTETYTVEGVSFTMAYVPGGMTFPIGKNDNGTATVANTYLIGKTQVPYELWKTVYDWAVHTDRGDNVYTFQNPGRQGGDIGTGDVGTEKHPVTTVSWRDVVIWCNALSEMSGAEVVYEANGNHGTTEGAVLRSSVTNHYSGNNVENVLKTEADNLTRKGFRLLTNDEWELAARFRGTDSTNVVTGTKGGVNFDLMTTKWTKGNSASGATTFYNDSTGEPPAGKLANDAVAVYRFYWTGLEWEERPEYSEGTKPVAGLTANTLGLYDMSGNVLEWTDTAYQSQRFRRGGSWGGTAESLQVFYMIGSPPDNMANNLGFRLGKTAD